ncbi:FecR family protein [Chitinophaga japonensis]|uniref:FecR family protein n=1 Tax=Chitinophaga japonensis TaxID=104662 RepID=A0A562STM5_CHIJA|nr:FecR family protein [Chitinophaga japonensis]TWI84473.1 FecR family protein [Chitinophaga japonensis]
MTKERLQYLLDRYLQQTATEAELQEYAVWYEQAVAAGERLFEDAASTEAQAYSDRLFTGIMHRLDAMEQQKQRQRNRSYLPYIKWAAAAMLAGALFLLYNGIRTRSGRQVAGNTASVQEAGQPHLVTIKNPTAGIRRIRLKDGTSVELMPGSELDYEDPFGHQHRHVHLRGKGWFNVAQDPARPFTVFSHDMATTALGTAFTITALPAQNEVTVLLHTGKVVVKHHPPDGRARINDIYLLPGQQVSCDVALGKATLLDAAEQAQHTGVAAGNNTPGARTGFAAAFDQVPLPDLLDTIQSAYGVQVQYNRPELSDKLFTGKIRGTDTLSQVLKRIAILYNLQVKATGNTYIIQKTH